MNFRKLLTYLTVSTAAVIPFASAQNPTILQGNYISNVFGNSNFVKNPNAQTNVANVTTVTATVTRSTVTPLVATSEFNVAIGTANGTATWALRAFDAGMKNNNCEARFTYRGFAATSKVQIKQGANVVAELVLTPSATDPRIASINFPCGDLSTATTFVVTDTAILAGTNEIGAIYTGLATNMANVAQAEFVGGISYAASGACQWSRLGDATWANFASDTDCPPTPIGVCSNATNVPGASCNLSKPGRYEILVQQRSRLVGQSTYTGLFRISDGTNNGPTSLMYQGPNITSYDAMQTQTLTASFEYTSVPGTKTFQVQSYSSSTNTMQIYGNEHSPVWEMKIYRFPSSSELVVTPERQNTFAAASWTGATSVNRTSTAEITISDAVFATNRILFGKAQFTGTANDVAITVPNMPAGTYRVELTATSLGGYLNTAGPLDSGCFFYLKDGSGLIATAASSQYGTTYSQDFVSTATQIYTYTSVSTRTFTASLAAKNTNNQQCIVAQPKIIITPLDQPSNSALYVQGPIKAAATGADIPAKYVGEVKHSATTPGCGTANQYNDGASVSLTPGIWQVTSQAVLGLTSTSTVTNWIVFTGPTTGNSSTWRSNDLNDYSISGISVASVPGITQPLLVKYDGTNLFYFANGSYTGSTASASGTIYAKYLRNHSGTCGLLNSSISAIRLN